MFVHVEGIWGPRIQNTVECAVMIRRFLDRIADVAPCLDMTGGWSYYVDATASNAMLPVDDTVAGLTALLDASRMPTGGQEEAAGVLPPDRGSHLTILDDRERGLSMGVRCGSTLSKNTLSFDLPDPVVMRGEERVLCRPDIVDALLRVIIEECAPDTAAFFDVERYNEQIRSPLPNFVDRHRHEKHRRDTEVRLGWETFIAGDPVLHRHLLPPSATVEKTLGGTLIRLGDDPMNTAIEDILGLRLALGYPPKEAA